jgi:hypothetical protein
MSNEDPDKVYAKSFRDLFGDSERAIKKLSYPPAGLNPEKDADGRYWRKEQVKRIKRWLQNPDRVYLDQLSIAINRKPNTIRIWERSGLLPEQLFPHRDERDWRYWDVAQVKEMQAWMSKELIGPGRGFAIIHGKV